MLCYSALIQLQEKLLQKQVPSGKALLINQQIFGKKQKLLGKSVIQT